MCREDSLGQTDFAEHVEPLMASCMDGMGVCAHVVPKRAEHLGCQNDMCNMFANPLNFFHLLLLLLQAPSSAKGSYHQLASPIHTCRHTHLLSFHVRRQVSKC